MTASPESGVNAPASGKGLRTAGRVALLLSVLGVVLGVMELRSSRPLHGGLIFGLLGMALSVGTLVIALVRGPRYPKEAVENLGASLLLPYILIQPLCYFEILGFGLGGDMIRSGNYGTLSLTALVLIPVTFFGLLYASRRSRGAE